MARYYDADELPRLKFHPLPYTHITPADIKDAEAYERGWNDAIDAIIENASPADVVDKELYDRLLENSIIISEALNKYQTADMVEVVKCKNCKWWDNEDNRPLGYCHAAKHCHYSRHWEIQIYRTTEPDFFCKDGERRGNE